MARSVIWTEDFCKKILAEISKYPDNLVVGMERAAEKYPQVSLSTIKTYYYKKGAPLYKIRTECKSLVMFSVSRRTQNIKNNIRINGDFTSISEQFTPPAFRIILSWWNHLYAYLRNYLWYLKKY